MAKKPVAEWVETPIVDVKQGDTVRLANGSFVVAGTRRNPTTFAVRLFDDTSTIRHEGHDPVQVQRG